MCACAVSRNKMKVAGILLLFLWSATLSPGEPTYGEFTVELISGELMVGSTCLSSYSGSPDTTRMPCDIAPGSVSTLVQLSTCLPSSSLVLSTDTSGNSSTSTVLNSTVTLVAHLAHYENCTSTEGCKWSVELTERLLENQCIDVYVADSTTSRPPLRGIRKKLWIENEESNELSISELPQCLESDEDLLFLWSAAVRGEDCSSGTIRSFSTTGVYPVSSTEIFVTANSSILYSPCRGCIWYQLLLPASTNITSFQYINGLLYALLTVTSSGDAEVWMGLAGTSSPLLVYPSPTLQWMWTRDSANLNSFLMSASLTVDTQGQLVARSGNEDVILPISLLLSQAFYDSLESQSNSTLTSSLQLPYNDDSFSLEERPHPLLHLPQISRLCPLSGVIVEAPICDQITRSVVEIEGEEFLGSLPWVDCSEMSDSLPRDIFLRRRESYVFTVHLILNPLLAEVVDIEEQKLVPILSQPGVLDVWTEGVVYHTTNNTLQYQVTLQEKNESIVQTQVPSSTIIHSVNIDFQISDIGMECIQPLDPRPNLPGRLQTRVHIGCPPGLYLVFDHITTQSHDSQFCTTADNISCYYFGNEFRPVMQLVDSVTSKWSTYTGPYTLRILAGGTSRSNMQNFNPTIQTDIWTASVGDIIRHDNNKIEWICGLGSPCGEVLPSSQGSPEYFFLIQASNRVVGGSDTYCDLTVEFTIRLHGLSMGPITTSIALIVLLVLWVGSVISLFFLWMWREKKRMAGEEGQDWFQRWYGTVMVWLRKWVREIMRLQQTQQPVEPHMHTD